MVRRTKTSAAVQYVRSTSTYASRQINKLKTNDFNNFFGYKSLKIFIRSTSKLDGVAEINLPINELNINQWKMFRQIVKSRNYVLFIIYIFRKLFTRLNKYMGAPVNYTLFNKKIRTPWEPPFLSRLKENTIRTSKHPFF